MQQYYFIRSLSLNERNRDNLGRIPDLALSIVIAHSSVQNKDHTNTRDQQQATTGHDGSHCPSCRFSLAYYSTHPTYVTTRTRPPRFKLTTTRESRMNECGRFSVAVAVAALLLPLLQTTMLAAAPPSSSTTQDSGRQVLFDHLCDPPGQSRHSHHSSSPSVVVGGGPGQRCLCFTPGT